MHGSVYDRLEATTFDVAFQGQVLVEKIAALLVDRCKVTVHVPNDELCANVIGELVWVGDL